MGEWRARLEGWQAVAERAARLGGEEIRRRFAGTAVAGTAKRGADLVTEADLAAEARILEELRRAEPAFGIVSEEAGNIRADAEYVWLVDPLDGTNNFAIGVPVVAVAICLLHFGEPIVAVTHDPVLGTTWSAVTGGGAWRDGQQIRVRGDVAVGRAVVAHVQGYQVRHELGMSVIASVARLCKRVLTNWAPARDWCLVAQGSIDGLISLDSEPEDQLGGALIAHEAGALLTDFAGRATSLAAARLLACGSPELQATLATVLAPLVALPTAEEHG